MQRYLRNYIVMIKRADNRGMDEDGLHVGLSSSVQKFSDKVSAYNDVTAAFCYYCSHTEVRHNQTAGDRPG